MGKGTKTVPIFVEHLGNGHALLCPSYALPQWPIALKIQPPTLAPQQTKPLRGCLKSQRASQIIPRL